MNGFTRFERNKKGRQDLHCWKGEVHTKFNKNLDNAYFERVDPNFIVFNPGICMAFDM